MATAGSDDGGAVVLGIDVATADVRALCVDGAGRVLARASAPLPAPIRSAGGRSEQDAGRWWPAAAEAARTALVALPGGGARVRSLAVAATSGTVALVDADRRPIGPALLYDDRRAARLTAAAYSAAVDRFAGLGLQGSGIGAIGRIAWLVREHGAAASGRRARVCHTGDLIGWHLTGSPVPTDWNSALKSGFDAQRLEWVVSALQAVGVPEAVLPEVLAPGTLVGVVGAAAAEETGLPRTCEVRLGTTDGCAGQLASGAVAPGDFVGVLGTTYVLKGVSRKLVVDPSGALYSHRHPDDWWLPGGASNTGGEGLARWPVADLAGLDSAAAARGAASIVSYPLRREGERFPFTAPNARGFEIGESQDDVDRYRAALEGVAFLERLALERVQALGIAFEPPLTAAGGGNRSDAWLRIRATVLGAAVRVVDSAETAFGAALLAATGSLYDDLAAATAAMVPPGRLVQPVVGEVARLEESYGRFRDELSRRGWLPTAG